MSKSLVTQGILCIALAAGLPALQAIDGLGLVAKAPGAPVEMLAGSDGGEPIPPVFSEAVELEESGDPDDYCPFGA